MDGRVDGGEDGIVAGQEAGGDGMRCPACGYENLIGADICENCGADIFGRDIPQQAPAFHGQLLGEHLDELGAPDPLLVTLDTPVDAVIARMQKRSMDCALVMHDDRLVGIFTDRDAVLKAAGRPLHDRAVRDFMTPDPVVLRHDDPLAVAIHKMAVGGFRHIPIVEDGRPTGVVTARDVFHHLAQSLGLIVAERVLVLAQDLIWADRLARAVTEAGAAPQRVGTEEALAAALADEGRPAFLVVDLTARAYDPLAAIGTAHGSGVHILAVGQHDDAALRKQALAAGADRVLAYRKLFEDGPATIRSWLDRAAAAPTGVPASAG